jgi:PKD domain
MRHCWNLKRTAVLATVAFIGLVTPSRNAGAQTPPQPTGKKPSKVAYILEKAAGDVTEAKAKGRRPATVGNPAVRITDAGGIPATVWANGSAGGKERAELTRIGADVLAAASGNAAHGKPAYGAFDVIVPSDRLADIAALDWVAAVTPSYHDVDTHPINPLNSEGVALHNADDVQTRGVNGTGVTVGVISNGVTSIATSQAQNELPAVNVLNAGSGDEGTAMLEIVHDMAPGAALLFNGTGAGIASHMTAQDNLVTAGANVITEDIPFDTEPAFQQGIVASHGDAIAAAGVSMHSSAGNLGQSHSARVVANGTGTKPDGTGNSFTGCPSTPDNVVAIAGGGDTTFDVTLGNGSSFVLQWSEPRAIFPTAGEGGFTDLNLYVMDAGLTKCLGASTGVQALGIGDTMEVVSLPGSLNNTAAKIVVDVEGITNGAAAPTIDLRWRGASAVDATTRAGSLNPDSNYTGPATSAAAVNANSNTLEGFSGGGPVALGVTTTCIARIAGLCTVTAAGAAGPVVPGPTWAAADGVTVSGVGGFGSPFFGTSAAAPHAAGCDALLRDETNNATAAPAVTNARLAATATDIAPAGPDSASGAGLLNCLAAVNDPPTANAGPTQVTPEGTDVQLDGTGSSDPDTGDSLTYAWDLDNDGQFDDSTNSKPTFSLVGQDGVFTVRLQVTDTAGATSIASTTVTVDNVAPGIGTITTDSPKNENATMTISGVISDPGWLDDPLTATISFGDGQPAVALTGTTEGVRPDATLTYSVTHTYGDDGAFTIAVCGFDDDTSTCATKGVTVGNVAPTAVIDKSGATIVNGTPTVIAKEGVPTNFSARSIDPGSDDLSGRWTWGDATPDSLTLSLNDIGFNPDPDPSPTVNPRDVTDAKIHTFGSACLYQVGFRSTDDDTGTATDSVQVIVAGSATTLFNAGYWQTQYRPRPTALSDARRKCYLLIAGYMSAVFNETTDASTVAKAFDVFYVGGNNGSAKQTLDRQILTAWMNFANGAFTLTTLVDTDGVGGPDTAFGAVIANAEAVRLNPASTDAALRAQKAILERING